LLDNYGILAKTIAYHKFNENVSADGIISLLKDGKNVAVISDAGMPIINDPGNVLAGKLHEENINYTIIPGANAGLSALILSGFDATKFAFFGFLSEKNKELKQQLTEIKNFNGTKIIYSSKEIFYIFCFSIFQILFVTPKSIIIEICIRHSFKFSKISF